jgi:hypothetical protein
MKDVYFVVFFMKFTENTWQEIDEMIMIEPIIHETQGLHHAYRRKNKID